MVKHPADVASSFWYEYFHGVGATLEYDLHNKVITPEEAWANVEKVLLPDNLDSIRKGAIAAALAVEQIIAATDDTTQESAGMGLDPVRLYTKAEVAAAKRKAAKDATYTLRLLLGKNSPSVARLPLDWDEKAIAAALAVEQGE